MIKVGGTMIGSKISHYKILNKHFRGEPVRRYQSYFIGETK